MPSGLTKTSLSGLDQRPAMQRTGLGALLAGLVAVGYYGFLLLGAYAPKALAQPAIGEVPWSFVLGAGLLVGAVASTGIYVLLSNASESRGEGGA